VVVDFLEFLLSLPFSDIQVFSDKSKSKSADRVIDYRSVIYQYNLQITRKIGSFGLNIEVFDTKTIDTLEKIYSIFTSPGTKLATDI